MPRGRIADLDWPLIRKIRLKRGRVSWLLDSGDRVRPRVRLRYKSLALADAAAVKLRAGVALEGPRQLTPIEKNQQVLAKMMLDEAGSKKSLIDVVDWYIEWHHAGKKAPTVPEAVEMLVDAKVRSPRYSRWLGDTLRPFADLHKNERPGDVPPHDIRGFIHERKDITDASRHNIYRALSRLYHFCLGRHWIPTLP